MATDTISVGWSRCTNCRTKHYTRSDRVVRALCEKCGGGGLVDQFAAMQQEPELDREGNLLPGVLPEIYGEQPKPPEPARIGCQFCELDYATEFTYHQHLVSKHSEQEDDIAKSLERCEIIRRKELENA